MADVGEPFTRPQLEVFLAGLLMSKDGEATISADVVRKAENAADGIRMVQLCHNNGDITIELMKPWPSPCARWKLLAVWVGTGRPCQGAEQMIYIPVALVGACCAVVAYIVLDRLWPEKPLVDLTEPERRHDSLRDLAGLPPRR